jgi:hypothetical protein
MALFSTAVNCKYPEKETRQKGLMNCKQDELRIWTGSLYLKPNTLRKKESLPQFLKVESDVVLFDYAN